MARPLLQRYEIKYAVQERQVPAIREFFLPHMQLDPYSERVGGGYPISSLYLDNGRRLFAHETSDGVKQRFKMRIRAYDDDPAASVFCELKHRDGDVISKTRVRVARRDVPAVLDQTLDLGRIAAERDRASMTDFWCRARRWKARPTIVVRYDREAYESRGGAPVRITFDRHIRRARASGSEIPVDVVPWETVHWHPDPTTLVLELKFTGSRPGWLHQMIRALEIRQRGVGKYVLSMRDADRRKTGTA